MELYLAEHPVRLAAEVRRHSGQGFFFPEVISQGIVEPPDELRSSANAVPKMTTICAEAPALFGFTKYS